MIVYSPLSFTDQTLPLGTAIYFLSPLWPYNVTTAVSLDSSSPSIIDLVDHSTPSAGQGSETVPSRVVWSAAGLSNTQHTLRISVGSGERYAIVDGLMYVFIQLSLKPLLLTMLILQLYRPIGVVHVIRRADWPCSSWCYLHSQSILFPLKIGCTHSTRNALRNTRHHYHPDSLLVFLPKKEETCFRSMECGWIDFLW